MGQMWQSKRFDWNVAVRIKTSDERTNQYDIVYGPVADDAIVASFQIYLDGRITLDELVERLRYRELSDQYSFHTPSAIALLDIKGIPS